MNFDPITSLAQWRSPNTWRISVNQLEILLNSIDDDKASLTWDFFSELSKTKDNNTQKALKSQIFDLPGNFVGYNTPKPPG